MNERIRNALLIALAGVTLIFVAIYFLIQVVTRSLAPVEALPPPTPTTQRVVIAARDLAIGEVLSEGDVTVIDVPVEVAPRNTLSALDDVLGRIIRTEMVAGQMVLAHQLADPTNINHDLAFVLPDDRVLFAFQPNDLMTNLGIPQRGDIVDILVTIIKTAPIAEDDETALASDDEEPTEVETFTLSAFQLIQIGAVVFDVITEDEGQQIVAGQPTPVPDPRVTEIDIHAYLLALSPQDALLLKHLQDTGAVFDLVLRSPTSQQLFELVPVTEDYLVDRYQLEAP